MVYKGGELGELLILKSESIVPLQAANQVMVCKVVEFDEPLCRVDFGSEVQLDPSVVNVAGHTLHVDRNSGG